MAAATGVSPANLEATASTILVPTSEEAEEEEVRKGRTPPVLCRRCRECGNSSTDPRVVATVPMVHPKEKMAELSHLAWGAAVGVATTAGATVVAVLLRPTHC
jgi:hypothetical protein